WRHHHRSPFALTTGEPVYPGLGMWRQLEFLQHRACWCPAATAFGRVAQRLADGEVAMHDVVLRHHADTTAQRGVLAVDVVPLERHLPAGGIGRARSRRSVPRGS